MMRTGMRMMRMRQRLSIYTDDEGYEENEQDEEDEEDERRGA